MIGAAMIEPAVIEATMIEATAIEAAAVVMNHRAVEDVAADEDGAALVCAGHGGDGDEDAEDSKRSEERASDRFHVLLVTSAWIDAWPPVSVLSPRVKNREAL